MVVHSGGRASGFRNRWVGLGEGLGRGLAGPLPAGLQGTHGGAQWRPGQWLQEQVGGVRGGVRAGFSRTTSCWSLRDTWWCTVEAGPVASGTGGWG